MTSKCARFQLRDPDANRTYRPKRPADAIGNAVKVMRIATEEEPEDYGSAPPKDEAAAAMGRKGGAARAKAITPEKRAEIASKAAAKRWEKA